MGKKRTDYIELINRLTHSKDGSVDYKIFDEILKQTGTVNKFKFLIDNIQEIRINNIEKSELDSKDNFIKLKLNMFDIDTAEKLNRRVNKSKIYYKNKEFIISSKHNNSGKVSLKVKPLN